MNEIAYVVEIRVNGLWLPAQRAVGEYSTEELAIAVAKENYPITCFIQAHQGPVGIRVMQVVTSGA